MKNSIWEKKIPSFLGILLVLLGTIATSLLVKNNVIFTSRASFAETPTNVRITNISGNSFSASYTTEESVGGFIVFGKDKTLGQTALDDRNQQTGTITPYKTHHMTMKNLSPSTKYYFSIKSGNSTFLNGEFPFEVTTGPTITEPPTTQLPISGKVVEENGTNPTEAIAYLIADGAQALSAFVKTDGTYIIPLNSLRNTNLYSYDSLGENSVLQILIIEGKSQSSVSVPKSKSNPIPVVILSKSYDFNLGQLPIASESANQTGITTARFPIFVASESATRDPKIVIPQKNQSFIDTKPLFRGTAIPNEDVIIAIHSAESIQAKIKTDTGGNWTYRPDTPISPGQHTIAITSRDHTGIIKTITQSFTVYAAGNQVGESATPSATPTINIPPSPTPTIIIVPTISPTSKPIPVVTVISPPKGGVQKMSAPGNSVLSNLGIPALITTGIGILLFLLTRGNASSL